MYKIIFSDIDGTLLKSDGTVDEKLKTKIQELVNCGIPFVLASARSGVGVFPILEMLDIKAPVIAFSGALIYDKDKNVIKSLEMTRVDALKIHNYILSINPDISVCTYAGDLWLCDKKDSWVINEFPGDTENAYVLDYAQCVNSMTANNYIGDREDILFMLKIDANTHSRLSTTANIYAHIMEEADQRNADILSDIFLKKA